MTDVNELSDTELSAALAPLGCAVKLFRGLAPQTQLPASAIAMFVAIATLEGKSVASYGRAVDVGFTNASRLISDLSDVNRYGNAGLGLVRKRPGRDERESLCFLTVKGRALAQRLAGAMAGPEVKMAA